MVQDAVNKIMWNVKNRNEVIQKSCKYFDSLSQGAGLNYWKEMVLLQAYMQMAKADGFVRNLLWTIPYENLKVTDKKNSIMFNRKWEVRSMKKVASITIIMFCFTLFFGVSSYAYEEISSDDAYEMATTDANLYSWRT